ncbi:hypothetical protein ACIG3E_13200 [Streptomyces sp. NPDC053474]|uniref:terminase gpP N-terminus-related DNA-binding protein n=1 Tax=Streptomyces sp. NPDC053474 TaxID=3365704 RepID=UPI0037D674A8
MTEITDFASLRDRAITLRRAGLSLRQIADALGVRSKDLLQRLVAGEPAPEWTKRPRAKDDLRERARELRLKGWTYNEIKEELGCSKSSVSLWVRDLPKPEPRCTPEEQRARMNAGLARLRAEQDRERAAIRQAATESIGPMSDRDLFIAGVALYWAEGTKSKPYARRERVTFVNSDPEMIMIFLRWLDLLEVKSEHVRYCVMIHETADVQGAEQYWADLVGADRSAFNKTTIKKHNPKTVRKNVGETYRGCLVVQVRQSAELYLRIEGWWHGMVVGVDWKRVGFPARSPVV